MKRQPFLLFGLVTFAVFLGSGLMSHPAQVSAAGQLIHGVLRVLVVPIVLMRYAELLLGIAAHDNA